MESLNVVQVSTITPDEQTERHQIEVSPEDRFFAGFPYVRDVLFYQLPAEQTADDAAWTVLVANLKRGLARVLVPFYPLAGRLILSRPDRIFIDCNDAGVEFFEATTTASFAELESRHFPLVSFLDCLAPYRQLLFGVHPDDVPLSVQITRFVGGGISVGLAAGHVMMDAQSGWHFLTSWAQCCRGEEVSLAPFHMRTALRKDCWDAKDSANAAAAGYVNYGVQPPEEMAKGLLNKPANAYPPKPPQELQKLLHFSRASVQKLKQEVVQHSGNPRISSLQAVLAHVWRSLVQAHHVNSIPTNDQHVWLLLPMDIRTRLLPSLMPAYFGNAVKPVLVQATLRKLVNPEHSEALVAMLIHDSIKEATTHKRVKQLVGVNRLSMYLQEAFSRNIHCTVVTSGSKYPIYDGMDLGFGRPLACRPPVVFDNLLLVYPSHDSGGIDISLSFPNHNTLNAFLQQPTPALII